MGLESGLVLLIESLDVFLALQFAVTVSVSSTQKLKLKVPFSKTLNP